MPAIAGIVFPDVFQMERLLGPMLSTLCHKGGNPTFRQHKNIQLGVCGSPLVEWQHLLVGLDGTFFTSQVTRATLQANGYPAQSASDTELIAFAYDFWGMQFLEHLEGDFAFFILDQKQEKLILARDRIGKKPLYWYHDSKHLLFASELKALLVTGLVPQTPALDGIASYLYLGYIPQDMSPIKGINKLLPGYYLQFNKDGSKSIQSYWSYSSYFKQKTTEDQPRILQKLDNLLQESVNAQIPKERPLACFVSGGLGSATVAYYLQKLVPHNEVRAFTVGFQEESSTDVTAAKEVTKQFKIKHETEIITPSTLLKDIVRIVWHLDEPLADPNILATWRLAKLARPYKFAFSGMGSDELMAGHARYTTDERKIGYLNWLTQYSLPFLKTVLLPLLQHLSKPASFNLLRNLRTNPWQIDYLNQNALFKSDQLAAAAPGLAEIFDPRVFLNKFHNLTQIDSPVSSFLYFDVKTRLADSYILQYDRLTVAQDVDWRTPFLSRELIEYLATMPSPQEISSNETFPLLKPLLKNTLPASFLQRPKRTRKDFLKSWVELSGLSPLFHLLSRGTLVEQGLLSGPWVKRQVATTERQQEAFPQLWGLLILEIWFRLYINSPTSPQPPDLDIHDLLAAG